jgi:hypothetical protein
MIHLIIHITADLEAAAMHVPQAFKGCTTHGNRSANWGKLPQHASNMIQVRCTTCPQRMQTHTYQRYFSWSHQNVNTIRLSNQSLPVSVATT